MSEIPHHRSTSTVKSLWQEYRIYRDHLEFRTHLGTLTIPFTEIETVSIRRSDLVGLLHGDLRLKNFRPALKLDWANFCEHVELDKRTGVLRRILFTPDDPSAFKAALESALAAFRK